MAHTPLPASSSAAITSDAAIVASDALSDARYHELSDALLGKIEALLDAWLDEDVVDIDTQRTGGLLQLSLPGGSKIIINTQPPLHEIWMAARSGGFHFKHSGEQWLDTRSGAEFFTVLSHCLSDQCARPLVIQG